MAATEQLHPDDRPPDPAAKRGIPRGLLWALALAVVVLTIASWVALSNEQTDDGVAHLNPNGSGNLRAEAMVGKVAPTFTLSALRGGTVASGDLKGRPVVVNFWASTCTPCITEMPELELLHQQYGDKVAFVGIATADRGETFARAMADKTAVTFALGYDGPGNVATSFGAVGLPSTYVIDADGVVRYQRTNGAVPMEDLRTALDPLTR